MSVSFVHVSTRLKQILQAKAAYIQIRCFGINVKLWMEVTESRPNQRINSNVNLGLISY